MFFWPSRTPDCTTEERYPYWTWPGGGDPAVLPQILTEGAVVDAAQKAAAS